MYIHGGVRGQLIRTLCEEFSQQSNGKYLVNPIYVEGSYEGIIERLMLLSLSDNLPELCHSGHNYLQFMTENLPVVPVQIFIDRDGYDISDIFPKMLDLSRDASGRIVGIPWMVSTGILCYNKEMFEANGINELPRTFDEMRGIAQRLTKDGNYGFYVEYEMTGLGMIQSFIENYGGQMLSTDRKSMGFYDAGLKTFELLNTLINIDKSMPLTSMVQAQEMFKAGKIGMYLTSTGNIRAMQNDAPFTVRTAPHPTVDGNPYSVPAGGASTYILTQDSKKQETAWEFIKYTNTPEVATRIAQTWGSLVISQYALNTPEMMGDFLKNDPAAEATYYQAPYLSSFFNFPGSGGTRYVEITQNNIAAMLQGEMTPEQALQNTIIKLNELIAQD
jgi:multiple sugar transport system substrate-binding protein